MLYWSGCNYHINQGNNEHEPVGTATSIHDCEGCNLLNKCLIKRNSETWEYNDDVAREIDQKWKEMNSK